MVLSGLILERDIKYLKHFGIYKIYCGCSNRKDVYIGSTKTTFVNRWRQHLYKLKLNKHENTSLQRICDKYGVNCLRFEIIELLIDYNTIQSREQYWIDYFNSYKNGYNNTPLAGNTLGVIRNEEQKSKFYKIVSQYNLNGEYIKTFKSLKSASIESNTDYVTLSNACNGKIKTANGYQWLFGGKVDYINPTRVKHTIMVDKISPNGLVLETFMSYKEAALSVNSAPNTISTAVKKESLTYGFYWFNH